MSPKKVIKKAVKNKKQNNRPSKNNGKVFHFDLAIEAEWVLTMRDGLCEVLENTLVGIEKENITYIGNPKKIAWQSKKIIDARGQLLMPGLINGHTHLSMNLLRGLGDDQELKTWLHGVIFPLEAKFVSPHFCKVGAQLAAWEALLSGTTTVADMYYFTDHIAEALDQIGLRALIGQTVIGFPTPDNPKQGDEPEKIIERMLKKYGSHSRIVPAIAPHAPYTCSDELLKKSTGFAKKHNLPLMIHVSETLEEVETLLKEYSKSPVQRLYDLGLMDIAPIFAHGVHVSEEDLDLIQKTKTRVVHNPESNMKLSSGIAPFLKYIERGIPLGLGTDGAASNNNLDLFSEMDSAAKLHKLASGESSLIKASDILNLATYSGAQALGLEDQIGSVEVGKKADLILLDMNGAHLLPHYDIASLLVYSGAGRSVESVICNGKIVMKDRKVLHLDTNHLKKEVFAFQTKIKKHLS